MIIVFSQKTRQVLTVIAVAVILLLAAVWGAVLGKALAQSDTVVQTAKNLATGIEFFYNDQNRFPSAAEFQNNNLMLNYFSQFPPSNFVSSNCPESFSYKRLELNSYQLNFCLPRAFGGYRAGWNQLNIQK